MATPIAWQSVNAVRHSGSEQFTRGFPVVASGLTIKDRLRVPLPQDPDSYGASREIVPGDMPSGIKRRHRPHQLPRQTRPDRRKPHRRRLETARKPA